MVTIKSEAVRDGPIANVFDPALGPTVRYHFTPVRIPGNTILFNEDGKEFHVIQDYHFGEVASDPASVPLYEALLDLWKAIQASPYIEIVPDTLSGAKQELARLADEAREEGYPVPSDLAFENARRLLPEICQLTPRPVAVYADPDDGIVIDISGGFGRSVGLYCESGGGALCMVNLDGEHRRARYDNTRTLPDGFIREALAELESKPRG